MDVDSDAKAYAGVSTIALPERSSGELTMVLHLIKLFSLATNAHVLFLSVANTNNISTKSQSRHSNPMN